MRRLLVLGMVLTSCGKTPHQRAPLSSPMTWKGATIPRFSYDGSGDFYRYAPGITETEPGVRHLYSCGNAVSGVVRDHVVHRVATRDAGGSWALGPEQIVLGPTSPDDHALCFGFDCYHTCDPELLGGQFHYNGTAYSYLLLYTGADYRSLTNQLPEHNSIGVAFANDPAGPFVRLPAPLIPYGCEDDAHDGTLQPSAISIDGAGRFLLFVRSECAHRGAFRYEVDLSDVGDGRPPVVSAPVAISMKGFSGYGGGAHCGSLDVDTSLVNGDWAFDAGRDRFYLVRHQHPIPSQTPNDAMGNPVPCAVQVATISGDALRNGGASASWQPLGNVAGNDDGGNTWVTGLDFNHNAGLVRDAQGKILEPDALEVAYTGCDLSRRLFGTSIYTVRATFPSSWR